MCKCARVGLKGEKHKKKTLSGTAPRVLTDGLILGPSGLAQTTGGPAPLEPAGRKERLDQVTTIVVCETGTITQHSQEMFKDTL